MEQHGLPPDPAARQAYQQRFAELYDILQRIARRELGHTPRTSLDTTVLVHEAYLKLHRQPLDVSQRGPFLALAAKAMRHVLVDHIRARQAEKRGGGLVRVTLHTDLPGDTTGQIDLLALERGLQALDTLDPRLAIVVECRFYGGLEFQEIAAHLGVTPRTVNRDWRKARAFLLTHLEASA